MTRSNCLISLVVLASSAVAQQLPFGDLSPGLVKPSVGCRAFVEDEASRKSCALTELRHFDGRLNAHYRELRKTLRPGEASALQATQREWLKQRDATCKLGARVHGREAWLAYVAEHEARADCVLGMTERRVAELERMQNQLAAAPVFAQIVPQSPEPAPTAAEEGTAAAVETERLVRSTRSHRSGKHYFEVVIDHGRIRDQLDVSLIARVNDGERWVGTSYRIRAQDLVLQLDPDTSVTIVGGNLGDIRLPQVVVGVAVDLDAGQLYRHRDGKWVGDAAPGSRQGIALRGNVEFRAEVFSNVALKPLIEEGIVAVNFGDAPFARLPAGYLGFNVEEGDAKVSRALASLPIYSPRERIAGNTQVQWIQHHRGSERLFSCVTLRWFILE